MKKAKGGFFFLLMMTLFFASTAVATPPPPDNKVAKEAAIVTPAFTTDMQSFWTQPAFLDPVVIQEHAPKAVNNAAGSTATQKKDVMHQVATVQHIDPGSTLKQRAILEQAFGTISSTPEAQKTDQPAITLDGQSPGTAYSSDVTKNEHASTAVHCPQLE